MVCLSPIQIWLLCFGNEASRDSFVSLFRHWLGNNSSDCEKGSAASLLTRQLYSPEYVYSTCAHTFAPYTAPE